MLGHFNLLPFLKGWDYRFRTWTRTVKRGETLEVERRNESGWLMLLGLITTDCYGGITLEYQGADLELSSWSIHIEYARLAGAFAQDPSGWIQLYNRPNPKSTVGQFVGVMSPGFQGSILTYIPTTIVKLFLGDDSTQSEALVSATTKAISITDPRLFMRSLRSVLGMPTILPIDPALLVGGREELTLKGVLEKKEAKTK